MKRKRFAGNQIIAILRAQEVRAIAGDSARSHDSSEATRYHWRAKHGGTDVSGAKRSKALEDGDAKLRKLVADQLLEVSTLRKLLSKKS